MATIRDHRDATRIDGDPMLAEAVRVPCCRLTLDVDRRPLDLVLADVRQRIADGERSPVLARHVRALGLDDVLIALARGS